METYLGLKWSTSRGRDTYGYNIVTLTDTTTGKRYRTIGGGYDMVGTVFGEWLQEVHQDKLRKIKARAHQTVIAVPNGPYERMANESADALYGMTLRHTPKMCSATIALVGACGLESMRAIAEAAGLHVRALVNRRGNTDGFVVSEES